MINVYIIHACYQKINKINKKIPHPPQKNKKPNKTTKQITCRIFYNLEQIQYDPINPAHRQSKGTTTQGIVNN